MTRNKDGNYVNEKGVTIKVTTDKTGKTHMDFYDKTPREPHNGVHVTHKPDSKDYSAGHHNIDKSEKDSHDGSCYLTTSCMKHFQQEFDDKGYELQVLRWFRDNFVSKEHIDHYYQTAPIVVDAINKNPECDNIYRDIYENVIDFCVKAIEEENYLLAYDTYRNSILNLEETYAKPELQQRITKVLRRQVTAY